MEIQIFPEFVHASFRNAFALFFVSKPRVRNVSAILAVSNLKKTINTSYPFKAKLHDWIHFKWVKMLGYLLLNLFNNVQEIQVFHVHAQSTEQTTSADNDPWWTHRLLHILNQTNEQYQKNQIAENKVEKCLLSKTYGNFDSKIIFSWVVSFLSGYGSTTQATRFIQHFQNEESSKH